MLLSFFFDKKTMKKKPDLHNILMYLRWVVVYTSIFGFEKNKIRLYVYKTSAIGLSEGPILTL